MEGMMTMSAAQLDATITPLVAIAVKILLAYLAAHASVVAATVGRTAARWVQANIKNQLVQQEIRRLVIYALAPNPTSEGERFRWVYDTAAKKLPWLDKQELAHFIEAELVATKAGLSVALGAPGSAWPNDTTVVTGPAPSGPRPSGLGQNAIELTKVPREPAAAGDTPVVPVEVPFLPALSPGNVPVSPGVITGPMTGHMTGP